MALRMALAAATFAGSSAVPASRLEYSACVSSSTSIFCANSQRKRSEEMISLLRWIIRQSHLLYVNRETTLRWHSPPGSVISIDLACRSAHFSKTATSRRRTSSSPNALCCHSSRTCMPYTEKLAWPLLTTPKQPTMSATQPLPLRNSTAMECGASHTGCNGVVWPSSVREMKLSTSRFCVRGGRNA